MKICRKCNEPKELSEYHKRKDSRDGHRNECKICFNNAVYNQPNRKITKKKEYEKNRDRYLKKVKEYAANNREEVLLNKKIYGQTHKPQRNKRHRERYRTDSLYRTTCIIRGAISKAMCRNGFSKKGHTKEILGCTFEELMLHLETQFKPGMNWENYGDWHIDHKVPSSWAKSEEEIIKLNHYTNLQPLWAAENLSKRNFYSN